MQSQTREPGEHIYSRLCGAKGPWGVRIWGARPVVGQEVPVEKAGRITQVRVTGLGESLGPVHYFRID